ncbi:hypothetical protein [Streptosporangium canum]|uniref:hypothetical protein n=1 Tax=Streptosporangium canum TaxID=324952 RepID=UPI0037B35EEF
MLMDDTGTALARALMRAELTPRALIRAVNRRLVAAGYERLSETVAYRWVGSGAAPRDAHVPALVASVLSEATGHRYCLADLWPGRTGSACISADENLHAPPSVRATVDHLHELSTTAGPHRRTVAPVDGAALLSAARAATDRPPAPIPANRRGERVLPPMMTLIEAHVADLRALDDRTGGGTVSQRYVAAQLAAALDLLSHARCEAPVAARLLTVTAELARIAGWMHYDANAHGAAQRYLLLGLRLACAAQDTVGQANILGMLAYQAAHTRAPKAAVDLAEAAVDLARSHGPAPQARAHGRLATAHAAAGDLNAYRRAADTARALLEHTHEGPDALYYLTPRQLDAEAGQALVTLAGTHRIRSELLNEATLRLTPLSDAPADTPYPRSALLHGCYLAQALTGIGDITGAAHAVDTALDRLPGVQSVRCTTQLITLRAPLARYRSHPDAQRVVERLGRALAAT